MRFGNLGIRQSLDDLHRRRRARSALERAPQEQAALLLRSFGGGPHPGAEQAVAAAEVVIQKAERCPDGKGVKPQRDLGQFHRHRVLVHAVDTALQHHAADDLPVVELSRIERPATVVLGVVHDRVADPVDPLHQRR